VTEAHEVKGYDALLELHDINPDRLLGDKAYDSDDIRNDLADRGIEPVIPPRSNRKTPIEYDREAYKRRNLIERCVNRLKQFRRIATRRGQLFAGLESGEADAALIPVHRFDAYRIAHPDSKLAPSGYYLPIGFNMGFVGLASASPLIEQANGAIDAMLKDGELAALARAAQMTYLPPRLPYILDHLTMTDITNSELSK
jgi:transposase